MNTTSAVPVGYEAKPTEYFAWARPEMLPFVPAQCHKLLDVGCGAGAFGELLKQERKIEIWGVEPVRAASELASSKLDHVINEPFTLEAKLPAKLFDCIVFNDVLEHMAAPEEALRYAKGLLAPTGVIVASIPNIRYLPVVWQLLFRAQWEYADSGVLDKTHLRCFTKTSILRLFRSEGLSPSKICGINAYGSPPSPSRRMRTAYELANALSLGALNDMRFPQFAVVAEADPLS